jgi:hypothetical protein
MPADSDKSELKRVFFMGILPFILVAKVSMTGALRYHFQMRGLFGRPW